MARNKLQRRYVDVKKQDDNYEPRISSLTCTQQCTPDVFRDGNKSSKVWRLIQLKNFKVRRTVCFGVLQANKKKRCAVDVFLRLKTSTKGTPNVFTCSTHLTKVSLINLEAKMPEKQYT